MIMGASNHPEPYVYSLLRSYFSVVAKVQWIFTLKAGLIVTVWNPVCRACFSYNMIRKRVKKCL